MPTFKLPLSGDVTQTINPWTWMFNPVGSQFGLVNISLGKSSNPDVEQEVLEDVASYGKQLGRLATRCSSSSPISTRRRSSSPMRKKPSPICARCLRRSRK